MEDRRHYGFYVPLPSWFDLLELYDLCELHLVAAVRAAAGTSQPATGPAPHAVSMTGDFAAAMADDPFGCAHLSILSLSKNARLVVAGRLVIDCLAAARRVETGLYPKDVDQVQYLAEQSRAGLWRNLFVWIREDFRVRHLRAEPVAYALAAEHRARNRPNIV